MTPPAALRFNLIDNPWIVVRRLDGAVAELSLRQAFREADSIREVGGELPTQSFAITRLLLAILYRATSDDRSATGWETADWAEWWRDGLPLDLIEEYLDFFADRFDLFHPERPFFQVAALRTARDEMKDTGALILDLPSNNRLFTTRSGPASLRLSFAEAARWLVNAQAFDPSGIKSGAVGDPRVKGGRGYPIGLAWAGNLGGVMIEGDTLRETLLLNLVLPGESGVVLDAKADVPPWEELECDGPAPRDGLYPRGPVRLFTWQARRIRLIPDGDRVVGCILANGDELKPKNQHHVEPMTAWRYSEPQSKKLKTPTYMPRAHQADRAFWRGIGALLPQLDSTRTKDGHPHALHPAILEALATRSGGIDSTYRLRVRAVGVAYGSNNSVVDDVIDDRIVMQLALLESTNAELAAEATNAVSLADEGVFALRNLAGNLVRAAGGDGESARAEAGAAAYARLDPPYRRWLASLGDGTLPQAAMDAWKTAARGILRELGDELIRDAGPAAWAGREVRGRAGMELVTTARAAHWFAEALRRTFRTSAEAAARLEAQIHTDEPTGEEPAA
ncbi:type I-E CRISPR-associated protein Cse1/CasA [Microbacterium album]|uniref:Type I-E CRISPR-associated protein Cse1/CasA n=1 Tax=Microbacterium album TaxID=2053191 RepID=A0A917MNI8_9MICO|nr:type I-E CRISPR-associated protein Cse1/CasA [Microbacterium album]GGH51502.1 type I-E CRISPR-associated protein Cse1/CasA [Microbacterium album]